MFQKEELTQVKGQRWGSHRTFPGTPANQPAQSGSSVQGQRIQTIPFLLGMSFSFLSLFLNQS